MKNFLLIIFIFIAFAFIYLFAKPEYRSAFEADQQCHYEISSAVGDLVGLGCDHDTETKQWIMFDASDKSKPAKVLKRFRY